MNNPVCPRCAHRFPWSTALGQVLGPGRRGTALWGAVCPACAADLKVPNWRVLLIAAAGIFFGSQSSVLLLLGRPTEPVFWALKVLLIVVWYAIAVFVLFDLEPVDES